MTARLFGHPGSLLRVTFTAPWTASSRTRYLVTWSAGGCSGKKDAAGRAGQRVNVNVFALDGFCEGPIRVRAALVPWKDGKVAAGKRRTVGVAVVARP